MRMNNIFILLLLIMCCYCSDKSTDPGNSNPEPEKWKHFTVYAGVKDSTGAPVRMAWVFLFCYADNETYPSLNGSHTNSYGTTRIYCTVLNNKDSVTAYAFKDSNYSDSVQFQVESDGQESFLVFELEKDTMQ